MRERAGLEAEIPDYEKPNDDLIETLALGLRGLHSLARAGRPRFAQEIGTHPHVRKGMRPRGPTEAPAGPALVRNKGSYCTDALDKTAFRGLFRALFQLD